MTCFMQDPNPFQRKPSPLETQPQSMRTASPKVNKLQGLTITTQIETGDVSDWSLLAKGNISPKLPEMEDDPFWTSSQELSLTCTHQRRSVRKWSCGCISWCFDLISAIGPGSFDQKGRFLGQCSKNYC